jgi:hypothetical protein
MTGTSVFESSFQAKQIAVGKVGKIKLTILSSLAS